MFEHFFSFWRRLVNKKDDAAPRGDDERRLWVRYPADLTATVLPSNGISMRMSSRIRNISRGGVKILVDHSFAPGDHIALELPLAGHDQTQSVLACVMHAEEETPGQWALGCVFSHELADEDLEGLGGKRVKHEASDQRTWVRFATNVHARFKRVADGLGQVHDGKVLNVSASGVGLQVAHRIDPGALLSVDFLDSSEKVRQTMLACVVQVSACEGNEWALGCNFIRQLSETDLQTLV